MKSSGMPDAAVLRRLAVRASVDPRTLMHILKGHPVRGMAGERARHILSKEGLLVTADTNSLLKEPRR